MGTRYVDRSQIKSILAAQAQVLRALSIKAGSQTLKGEVLEVRNVDGRLHIARKPREYDEWDPYIPPYDPYGPGPTVTRDVGDEDIDD